MKKIVKGEKILPEKIAKHVGLIIIVLAAVLLEVVSAIQYHHTHGILERNLEHRVLTHLMVSALRMDAVLSNAETTVFNQIWHAERHLDDPEYMKTLLYNLTYSESDKIVGAAICFRPNYYPSKGYWYEPYARQGKDTVTVRQIGTADHDYTTYDFYKTAISGDTLNWMTPYMDDKGAQAEVTTFAMPIRDKSGEPVAVMAVDVTTEWISEVVNKTRTVTSSFCLVLSPEGQLIAQPNDSLCSDRMAQRIAAMINDSTIEKEMKANGRVTGFSFYDDEKGRSGHVYYAFKSKAPKWLMVRVCYDDEAFGELQDMRKHIMWMALAGLLILGLIIHLFAKNGRRLVKSQMKQERIEGELKIASDIQTQMLPRESSIMREDITLHGSLTPAREVGGDLYDFFIRDEKLFFCVGDVSGKGVPSAMLMAVTHSLFRSSSLRENNPQRIMQTINHISCNGNESNMFVTLFIGVLDLPTGRLHYCNAGHDKPIIIQNGDIATMSCEANLPVGVFDDIVYREEEVTLPPSATFFIYTDGLTEARRGKKDYFGLERVMKTLQKWVGSPDGSPQALIQLMAEAVRGFVDLEEQSDDLTMLALKYTPIKEDDRLNETLTLKNDPRQIAILSSFIKDVAKKLDLKTNVAHDIRLALEEAVTNVMDYAYPAGVEGNVTIDAKSDGRRLKLIISDSGAAFDPTRANLADTSLSAEDRPIGGLGILLVRQLTDSLNYERIGGKNVLTLIKNIKS